ncbi:MAG TPA: pentapeptide repeat-containing protein, partial [Dongiaceae bacterium]|nr:pentapeptide repeat-containing protein [Dongiaceae bacterium]
MKPSQKNAAKDGGLKSGFRISRETLKRIHELHTGYLQGRRDGRRAMFEKCDLTGLDLSHMNFSEAIFLNCNLRNIEGRGVKFVGAILRGSKFDNAKLINADFSKADLRSTSFEEAQLINAFLERSDLRLDLGNAEERMVSFKNADLTRASFAEA